MLFLDKKANMKTIVGLILIVAGFGLVLTSYVMFQNAAKEILDGKECQATLGLQRVTDKIPFFTLQNSCKTMVVEIPSSKITSKKIDLISKEIARKVTRTWDIIHKGNIVNMWIEGDWDTTLMDFMGGDDGCMIMYEINLGSLPVDTFSQKQLFEYMLKTPYKKVEGVQVTYLTYVETSGKKGVVVFPEALIKEVSEGDKDENKKGTAGSMHNKALFEENNQYAISVVSPKHNYFDGWFTDEIEPQTVLVVSSLKTALAKPWSCLQK